MRRHSLEDIKAFATSDESEVAWLRLKDRFGDAGLVCVGIIRCVDDAVWEIDTFLMSCRVMGRRVEDAFLCYLCELAAGHGAKRIQGVYRKTAKNKPVQTFFSNRGFSELSNPEADTWIYGVPVSKGMTFWPNCIARIDAESGDNEWRKS